MERRSSCPISFSLDLLGDRWTLLVVRDLALKGKRTFSELHQSDEGIATNILSDRLARLEERGVLTKERDPEDRRRFRYGLTDAGKALLPVLVELIVWGATHDPKTDAPQSFVDEARTRRGRLLQRLRRNLEDE
ncbi:MAG: helix-turn-helix domain-containing protein [Myxococcota bacterium]